MLRKQGFRRRLRLEVPSVADDPGGKAVASCAVGTASVTDQLPAFGGDLRNGTISEDVVTRTGRVRLAGGLGSWHGPSLPSLSSRDPVLRAARSRSNALIALSEAKGSSAEREIRG